MSDEAEIRGGGPRKRQETGYKQYPRVRAEDGSMNLVGHRVKERRVAQKRSRREFVAYLATLSDQRWSPSEADLANIERQVRTVTDIEAVILAAATGLSLEELILGASR